MKGKVSISGQALVEFIFLLPLFISLFIGTIHIYRAYRTLIYLEEAAQYGIRLIVHNNYSNDEVKEEIRKLLAAQNITPEEINIKRPWMNFLSPVSVEIKYKIRFFLRKNITLVAKEQSFDDSWIYFPFSNLSQS